MRTCRTMTGSLFCVFMVKSEETAPLCGGSVSIFRPFRSCRLFLADRDACTYCCASSPVRAISHRSLRANRVRPIISRLFYAAPVRSLRSVLYQIVLRIQVCTRSHTHRSGALIIYLPRYKGPVTDRVFLFPMLELDCIPQSLAVERTLKPGCFLKSGGETTKKKRKKRKKLL